MQYTKPVYPVLDVPSPRIKHESGESFPLLKDIFGLFAGLRGHAKRWDGGGFHGQPDLQCKCDAL